MTQKELNEIKFKHVNNNLKIYHENKELITLYDEYINNIVELFDFIKCNESDLFYSLVFEILIEIGFFSADRNYQNNIDDFKELSIKRGINIINGEGVCRNLACFYEDVFSFFYNYPLKMCCYHHSEKESDYKKLYGNHVINLTLNNDTLYGIDLTNHCLFTVINKKMMRGLGFDEFLSYTPGGDLLFKMTTFLNINDDLFKEINETKKLINESIKKKKLTKDEYDKLVNIANEFIIKRKQIFQSFMIQNDELTHEIKKKMLLLK